MNQAPWMLIAAIASPFLTVLAVFFFAGRMGERLDNHGTQLGQHGARLTDHDDQLGNHKERLARMEGYRQGFRDASGSEAKEVK